MFNEVMTTHLSIATKTVVFGVAAAVQWFGPTWLQILVYLSVLLIAVGIIWKKLIRPIHELIKLLDAVLPMLRSMAEAFKNSPNAFIQLNAIVREFGTDSGTTLRDVVDRLEEAAKKNAASARTLEENAEAARQQAIRDRELMAELTESVNILRAKQLESSKSVDRIEAGGKQVATELYEAQTRAGKVEGGEAGEAADAAARRPKE